MDTGLEELLAEALAAWDLGGSEQLETVCLQHPEFADRLRELVRASIDIGAMQASSVSNPSRVGRYRLRRRLGGGGMGLVFEAEEDDLGRSVAIKLVRPERLACPGARERFRREAGAIAHAQHPAIVQLYEFGETDGIPYLVMPLLRGCAADALPRRAGDREPSQLCGDDLGFPSRGPWWRLAVELACEAAEGMAHMHELGIVHRDLKPSNLMLTEQGHAVVLDFGLAHLLDDVSLTRTGSTLGSPAYMSPEQLRGEAVDERTDVYSLGATLAFLVTLQPPFPTTDAEDLRARILEGRRRVVRVQNKAVPRELELVVSCAMDRDRRLRYSGMRAFASDLRGILHGTSITARGLPVATRIARFAQRRRATTGAAAAIGIAIALFPFLLWSAQRESLREVREANKRAKHDLGVATDAIDRLLTRAGSIRLIDVPAASSFCDEFLHDAVTLYSRLRSSDPSDPDLALRHADALRWLATDHQLAGRTVDAATNFDAALAVLTSVVSDRASDISLLRAFCIQGHGELLAMQGDSEGARARFEQARSTLDIAVADSNARARALARRSSLAVNLAQLDRSHSGDRAQLDWAMSAVVDARLACNDAGSEPSTLRALAGALHELGVAQTGAESLAAARSTLDEALGILETMPDQAGTRPSRNEMLAAVLDQLGTVCAHDEHRLDEAAALYSRALQFRESARNEFPHTPRFLRALATARHNLARLRVITGAPDEAVQLLRRAIEEQRAFLATVPDDPQAHAFLINHLDLLCFGLCELGRASELSRAADELARSDTAPHRPAQAARYLARLAGSGLALSNVERADLLTAAKAHLEAAVARGWDGEVVGRADAAFAAAGLLR